MGQEEHHDRLVAGYLSFRGSYDKIFADFQLSEIQKKEMLDGLESVAEARATASQALSRLVDAFSEFNSLSERTFLSRYFEYRAIEDARPASAEAERLKGYFQSNGFPPVSEAELTQIAQLMAETRAYSRPVLGTSWSPFHYDLQPVPLHLMPSMYSDYRAVLESQSKDLLSKARSSGFREETIRGLEAYYHTELNAYTERINRALDSHRARVGMRSERGW